MHNNNFKLTYPLIDSAMLTVNANSAYKLIGEHLQCFM